MEAFQTQLTSLLRAATSSSANNNNGTFPISLISASTLTTTVATSITTLTRTLNTLVTLLAPYLPTTLPNSPGEFVSLLVLAIALVTTFKILDYVRRVVVSWVVLALKLVAVILLLQVAGYVYVNGVEKSLRELGWVWGFVEGVWDNLGDGGGNRNGRGSRGGKTYSSRAKKTAGRGRWS